ncbi:mRNA capping enzyme-domain-containing protein [Cyathus striatus]|nr:mRNA capping enzyme-domain-containing protein [Cyathus striatus]
MPAFDPVRDAVLNSPIDQPSSFIARSDLSLQNTTPVPSSPSASPSIGRRATDLSVLLNSDSQQPNLRTPPPRSSALSHLLHAPDRNDDKLAGSEPLRRSSLSNDITRDSPELLSNFSYTLPTSRPVPVASRHRSSSPIPPHPIGSPSSRISFSSRPSSSSSSIFPSFTTKLGVDSPIIGPPPTPPPSIIPYNPQSRLTPAASILIPLSLAELEHYKKFRGQGAARLSKRKRADSEDSGSVDRPPNKKLAGDVGVVVHHYNSRPDVGVIQRLDSPIIGLKNFNNWVKSVLITRFAHPVLAASQVTNGRGRGSTSGKVLDMGCGKGGDITKWAKARVREVCAVDIAGVSVEQARARWESLRGNRFDASFATLDCYTESLSKAFSPAKLAQPFDVVSMQFCMHYAFETIDKAKRMLDNVSRYLRPGGVFIGTIPNADILLDQLDNLPKDVEDLSFGNSVYQIRFENRTNKPVFGNKYWFFLKDAVEDVPEYVVNWDNFVEMAAQYNLYPTYKKEFHQIFEEHREHPEFGPLMVRMKVVDANGESAIDEDQWEAANIYIAFAFEKR